VKGETQGEASCKNDKEKEEEQKSGKRKN